MSAPAKISYGVLVAIIGLPHAAVVIGVTFLCGLLPIVGNLISNTPGNGAGAGCFELRAGGNVPDR